MIIPSINISKALQRQANRTQPYPSVLYLRVIPGHQPEAFKSLQEIQYLDRFRDLQAIFTTASDHQKQESFSL